MQGHTLRRNLCVILAVTILLCLAGGLLSASRLTAGEYGTSAAAEGSPRPVWLISHRCNERGEITGKKPDGNAYKNSVQETGCNAVEVDVRQGNESMRAVDSDLHSYENPETIYLAHSYVNEEKDMTLSELFMDVKAVYPQVSLIMLDIKEAACMPQLNEEVHNCLDFYFGREGLKPPYIIYSVPYSHEEGKREQSLEMFIEGGFGPGERIDLRENEGICCDMSDDYRYAESWFRANEFNRCWYGDGFFTRFGFFKSDIEKCCKGAAALRDRNDCTSPIKKVESWTVYTRAELEKRLFGWGCDAVILGNTVRHKAVFDRVRASLSRNGCKLATIDDNPWESAETP